MYTNICRHCGQKACSDIRTDMCLYCMQTFWKIEDERKDMSEERILCPHCENKDWEGRNSCRACGGNCKVTRTRLAEYEKELDKEGFFVGFRYIYYLLALAAILTAPALYVSRNGFNSTWYFVISGAVLIVGLFTVAMTSEDHAESNTWAGIFLGVLGYLTFLYFLGNGGIPIDITVNRG